MTKIYLKTVLILIILNALLTTLLGFVSQWGESIILSGILHSSILIALIFTSYFFLQINGIKTSKVWSTVFIFMPTLIMIILLTRNLIQTNSGQFRELAYGFDKNGYFKPIHLNMALTGLIIFTNYLRFKKNYK